MSTKPQLPPLMDLRPRITVIGVGGAGCNAINNMMSAGLNGVEFVVANTDSQSLANSTAAARLQLGTRITEGLGAGSRPEIGEAAAEEAIDDIRAQIAGSHMVFVAAGMGGGTGTGAAAVIARAAKEMGILTVGVVTKPFQFEGARRHRQAEAGIESLRQVVDTLIVIPNQNLFRIANEKTTFEEAFVLADQVLYSGVACIVDLIVKEGLINLDFADVRTIMSGMGTAMMGTGEASGERRAIVAAEAAITNPLLDDVTLRGAKGLLLSITGSHNLTLFEVYAAANRVKEEIDPEANIIFGATFDDTLGDRVRVSIVASGLSQAAGHGAIRPASAVQQAPAQPQANYQAPAVASPAVQQGVPPQSQAHQSQAHPSQPDPSHAATAAAAALSPPPIPAGGHTAEAELQRRLSDALQQQASPEHHAQPAHIQPAHGPAPAHHAPAARDQWHAPGDVVIEAGFPEQTGPLSSAPPRMTEGFAPAPGQHGQFAPRATVEIRRSGRRIPGIEEFPPIGQRDYFAKKPDHPAGHAHAAERPANEPQRRQGLLERIAGKFRYESDSASLDQPQTEAQGSAFSNAQNAGTTAPSPLAHGHNQTHTPDSARRAENADLPVFFGARKRS